MQHKITNSGNLLDERGSLREPGYATSLISRYRREDIKAPKYRIKEWDYYLIYNDDFGLALTVDDNGYMSLLSASLLNFKENWEQTTSPIGAFPMGKVKLPSTSAEGVSELTIGGSTIRFETNNGSRRLTCHMKNFRDKKPLDAEITLTNEPQDSMVIATPFAEKKTAFYYNQKIIAMRAEGKMTFDGRDYIFSPESSFGLLDWGRGVWTYKNTWFWGAAQGNVNGEAFGFNIGYGFGDTSAASENMLFYKGVAHKFDRLTFGIPQKNGKDDFLSPWKIVSNDGRFDMDFIPFMDRASDTNVLLVRSNQHQVFGKFTGKAVLDDGTVLEIKDITGFAEKVYNKW